jgi:hypothetical protein
MSLARARRETALAAAVEREKQEIAGKPKAAARLKAYLAGELPTIKQDRSITIRVPEDFVARATALLAAVAADEAAAPARGRRAFGTNLSVVIRLALLEGLAVLEQRYHTR